MSTKTFITGKQASLEDSIATMSQQLASLGFQIQQNPVLNPVENIYSQHIFDGRCPGIFTNGKGACEKSCLASALGEFLERLSSNYFFSDYFLESESISHNSGGGWLYYPEERSFDESNFSQMLDEGLWDFYSVIFEDGDGFEFEDFLSLNDSENSIRALPLVSVSTGETAYFPMNILNNLYASNGLSAGNSLLEAKIQGLSEVFERSVKNQIFRENLCLPEVPDSYLENFPNILQSIQALKTQGIEVSVRDASLGGVFPVVNVTLILQDQASCFASFGAHPIFEVALERTLTESLQGRHLNNLEGFQTPVHDAELVADDENIENHFIDSSGLIHSRFLTDDYDYPFTEWTFAEDMPTQWEQMCQTVLDEGSDVYYAHYRQFGFDAVRLVVPGFSEVYPLEEMVENNQNLGRLLRSALMQIDRPANIEAFQDILEIIEASGFSDHQGVCSIIGLMPDKNSFWGQMTIAQLKFWLLLASGETQMAYQQAQDLIHFLHADNPWKAWFKGFIYLGEKVQAQFGDEVSLDSVSVKEMDLSDMHRLFKPEILESILNHYSAQSYFADQPLGKDIFKTSQAHQTLLEIYHGLRNAKLNALAKQNH